MKISNGFFVIEKVTKAADSSLQVRGHVLVAAGIDVESPTTSESSRPPIQVHMPYPLKWILPPKGSPWYDIIKAFAESMGYDTVEHTDFSYPPSR